MTQEITLFREAWYKDQPIQLSFPQSWEVRVLGINNLPSQSLEEIRDAILHPVAGSPLRSIVKPGSRVTIVVDDLTRPTPVQLPLKLVIEQLEQSGVTEDLITIVIGSGSHVPATELELDLKLGSKIRTRYRVVPHNCYEDLVDLGKTPKGTPLLINKAVIDSDVRIGIGCIYPHPAAGFSGGSKIIAPATAGAETIRYMHDHLKSAGQRAGSMESEFWKEIQYIADLIGLDFIVNLLLNNERKISAVFSGEKNLTHQAGIEFARQNYSIIPDDSADIVIADMYPFDIDLQFAHDRGFWPLLRVKDNVSKVILAACPNGIGTHKLYPVSNTLRQRYSQRLKNIHWRDLRSPLSRIRKIHRHFRRERLNFMMLSEGIQEADLKSIFPNATLYRKWDELLDTLAKDHPSPNTSVSIYRCAPFLIPTTDKPKTL